MHLTGITMALGEGPRALVLDVARRARAAGAIVTFDPNYRPALWESPAAAAAAMEPVLEHVDWYLCGAAEGETLLGVRGPEAAIEALPRGRRAHRRPRRIVAAGGETVEVTPARAEEVVDEIGAGDAFAAGFVYGLLQGWDPERCTHAAHVIAAGRCAAPATGRPCRGWTSPSPAAGCSERRRTAAG